MRIIGLHARFECRVDGALLNGAAQFLGRGERIAFRIDAKRVANGIGRSLHPLLIGAIGAVCDAERAAPWRNRIRLRPQFLGFRLIICEHAIRVEIGVISLDHRRKEIGGGRYRATENRIGDILTVNGMRDGLTPILAFLTLEMLEILRNRKC